VPVSATAETFVRILLDRFAEQVPEQYRGSSGGYSFNQILTLASIVEKEAALDDERPRMAGVYTYRLQLGQGLFADPTIIWVADSAALRKLKLSKWAPLCSPSLASIIAAREPDSSRKELYFVLIPGSGGRHDFSQTLAEHEAKARAYGWK
jgi:UPF0755 protein